MYRVGDFDFSAWDIQLANAVDAISQLTLPTNAQIYVDEVLTQYNKTYESVAAYNTAIDIVNRLAANIEPLSTAYVAATASYAIPAVAAEALATAVTTADYATYASIDDLIAQVDPLNAAVAEAKAQQVPPLCSFSSTSTLLSARQK